jgi:hypothetical protein
VLLLTALSVQDALAKAPLPAVVQLTVPVGVLRVPASLSVTVAVHVAGWPTLSGCGVQLTVVAVVRLFTVSVVDPVLPT